MLWNQIGRGPGDFSLGPRPGHCYFVGGVPPIHFL